MLIIIAVMVMTVITMMTMITADRGTDTCEAPAREDTTVTPALIITFKQS